MACESCFSLLCFQKNNTQNNTADNIQDQEDPSCAVTDKQVSLSARVPCFLQTFLGHVCVMTVVPPTQPTVSLFGFWCGQTPTAEEEQGAPFMSMWMSTAASATNNLPPDPLACRGQKNRRLKNTLHNALCKMPLKLIARSREAEELWNYVVALQYCVVALAWGAHRRAPRIHEQERYCLSWLDTEKDSLET